MTRYDAIARVNTLRALPARKRSFITGRSLLFLL